MKQLGQILLDEGLLTDAQLKYALAEQRVRGQSLGRTLVEIGALTDAQLVGALAMQVGMAFIDLDEERKAAMVSNLLVVLCGDRDVQPVVNTGSLYQ